MDNVKMIRGCTIVMRLAQFESDFLHNLTSGFTSAVSDKVVRKTWWTFSEQLEQYAVIGASPENPLVKYMQAWSIVNGRRSLCPGYHFLWDHGDQEALRRRYGYFVKPQDRRRYPVHPHAHFSLELKPDGPEFDPFSDGPGAFSEQPDQRDAVLEDLRSNAKNVFDSQHRTALFTLFVNGERFRVLHWDPAGLVATESINYVRNVDGTRALLRVLYAFTRLTREQQGFDGNVVRLSESSCGYKRMFFLAGYHSDLAHDERVVLQHSSIPPIFVDPERNSPFGERATGELLQLVRHDPTLPSPPGTNLPCATAIPVMRYVREFFRETVNPEEPLYRIKICEKDYLVGEPAFTSGEVVGKTMRGYIALEWQTQRFVFLKDTWAPCYEGQEREGAILQKLNESGVSYVPTLICHEEVRYLDDGGGKQETKTSRYSPTFGSKRVENLPPFPNPDDLMPWEVLVSPTFRFARRNHPDAPFIKLPNKANTYVIPSPHRYPERYPASMNTLDEVYMGIPDVQPKPYPMRPSGGDFWYEPCWAPRKREVPGEQMVHRVHARTVVEEIGMPLDALTSSRQLVRLIHEAIIAHEQAFTRCHYVHGDISGNNLLIHAVFRKMPSGRYAVYWQPLLTDWEAARIHGVPLPPGVTRFGTRAFFSVHRHSHVSEEPSISDELEAFLHLLVYCAVECMKGNLPLDSRFRNRYFFEYSFDPLTNETCSPEAKRLSVAVLGKLTGTGMETITFHSLDRSVKGTHAINKLIDQLLKTFQNRYIVWQWEKEMERHAAEGNDIGPPERPPQHVFDAAASLSTHETIRSLIARILYDDSACWPLGDIKPVPRYMHSQQFDVVKVTDYAEYPSEPRPEGKKRRHAKVGNEDVDDASEAKRRRVTRSSTAAQALASVRVTRSKARQLNGAGSSARGSKAGEESKGAKTTRTVGRSRRR